jgi:hypothetical protein
MEVNGQLHAWAALPRAKSPRYPPNIKLKRASWTFWPFKMGPIGCPETSVKNYHSTLRYIPEERRSQRAYTFKRHGMHMRNFGEGVKGPSNICAT